jgi:hypothetical protein
MRMNKAMLKVDWQSLMSRVAAVLVLLLGVVLAAGLCGASPLVPHP